MYTKKRQTKKTKPNRKTSHSQSFTIRIYTQRVGRVVSRIFFIRGLFVAGTHSAVFYLFIRETWSTKSQFASVRFADKRFTRTTIMSRSEVIYIYM